MSACKMLVSTEAKCKLFSPHFHTCRTRNFVIGDIRTSASVSDCVDQSIVLQKLHEHNRGDSAQARYAKSREATNTR